jgi:hypothetical protein
VTFLFRSDTDPEPDGDEPNSWDEVLGHETA